ncbi:hypothetical protein [Apibacter raozihei]|uniref:hypothetical protein n=1 Tax=Apibacter raozihei TaxID=2500547 RepID=UPI000FE2EAEC
MFNLSVKSNIVSPQSFETFYRIQISYNSVAGPQTPNLSLNTVSHIHFVQRIQNNSLYNTTVLLSANGGTKNEENRSALEKILILSDIMTKMSIKRNLNGKIEKLLNPDEIKKSWNLWKEKNLTEYMRKLIEQENFIEDLESSLIYLEGNFKKEIQYIALFPECYSFKSNNLQSTNYTSQYIFNSHLINELVLKYKLYPVFIKDYGNIIHVKLKSIIANLSDVGSIINEIDSLPDYKYKFEILADYKFDKKSGRIITSEVVLSEFINNEIQYTSKVEIKEDKKIVNKIYS